MRRRILSECLRIARDKNPTHPEFGAYMHTSFLFQFGRLYGPGFNRTGNQTYMWHSRTRKAKIHAETDVWRKFSPRVCRSEQFSVVNIRLNKQGYMCLSKPCHCCQAFLEAVGCSEVWFSTDIGFERLKL